MRGWPVIVLLLVVAGPASAGERYVLSVGSNVGAGSDVDLAFAEDDARRFVEVMRQYGRVDATRTQLLVGEGALELEAAIDALAASLVQTDVRDATVFFYFSGHADRRAIHVYGERIELERVEEWLGRIPAELRISVVDACRSAVDVRLKGFSSVEPFAIELQPATGVQGLVTLRSASDGEASQESDSLRGAVFTHFLLNALRGAADDDGDRRVTLDEAYRYAYRQTVRRSSMSSAEVMHPSVEMDIEGAGELVLTETAEASTRLQLPAARDVHYLVFLRPQSSVAAELWSLPTRPVEVALAPGDYLVHRIVGDEGGAARLRLGYGETRVLRDEAFTEVPLATLAAKGGDLELWQQELRGTLAGQIDDRGALAPRPSLRYSVGRPRWNVSLGLELGTTRFDNDGFEQTERWIGGDIRYARTDWIEGFSIFGGLGWRWIEQELERPDAEELLTAGLPTSERFGGFGGGPLIGAAYRLPIARRWTTLFEVSSLAVIRREGEDLRIRPEVSFGVGVAWSF